MLVTPEGDLFFQLGVCTVCPGDDHTYIKGREQIYEWLPKYESEYKTAFRGHWATDFSFYLANRIRKTGRPYELDEWKREQISRLRKWGFNSDGAFTTYTPVNAAAKFGRTPGLFKKAGLVGDIGDPFNETFRRELDENFAPIAGFRDAPTIIGYFIANEQPYGDVARKVPGFDGKTAAKRELVKLLERKYGAIDRFNAAWGLKAANFNALNDLPLPVQTEAAWNDMQEYSRHFFDAYFGLVARTSRNTIRTTCCWAPASCPPTSALKRRSKRAANTVTYSASTTIPVPSSRNFWRRFTGSPASRCCSPNGASAPPSRGWRAV